MNSISSWKKIKPYLHKIMIISFTWLAIDLYDDSFMFNIFIWSMSISMIESVIVIFIYFKGPFDRLKKARLPFMDTVYEWHWLILSSVLAGKGDFFLAIPCLAMLISNQLRTEV